MLEVGDAAPPVKIDAVQKRGISVVGEQQRGSFVASLYSELRKWVVRCMCGARACR